MDCNHLFIWIYYTSLIKVHLIKPEMFLQNLSGFGELPCYLLDKIFQVNPLPFLTHGQSLPLLHGSLVTVMRNGVSNLHLHLLVIGFIVVACHFYFNSFVSHRVLQFSMTVGTIELGYHMNTFLIALIYLLHPPQAKVRTWVQILESTKGLV